MKKEDKLRLNKRAISYLTTYVSLYRYAISLKNKINKRWANNNVDAVVLTNYLNDLLICSFVSEEIIPIEAGLLQFEYDLLNNKNDKDKNKSKALELTVKILKSSSTDFHLDYLYDCLDYVSSPGGIKLCDFIIYRLNALLGENPGDVQNDQEDYIDGISVEKIRALRDYLTLRSKNDYSNKSAYGIAFEHYYEEKMFSPNHMSAKLKKIIKKADIDFEAVK